jgi:hypothetical protein
MDQMLKYSMSLKIEVLETKGPNETEFESRLYPKGKVMTYAVVSVMLMYQQFFVE